MSTYPYLLFPRWLSQWSWFCLISMAVSQANIPGLKRTKYLKLKLPTEWKNVLRIERIKESILHSLNISKPPFFTARTLDVPKKLNSKGDPTMNHFETTEEMRNVSLFFAEATDPYKKDAMLFKIHSTLHNNISNIDTPLIILRLRVNKKRSSSFEENNSSERRRRLKNPCRKGKSSNSSTDWKECNNTAFRLSKKAMMRQIKRKNKRLQRQKLRKIKLIVRVLDPVTNTRRRIFAKKILLKKSQICTVPVPKNIFITAAESASHSLTVQVTCRKCKRYVKMDKVYKKGRRKNSRNSQRLNPNRPYLYVRIPSNSTYSRNTNTITNRSTSNINRNNLNSQLLRKVVP